MATTWNPADAINSPVLTNGNLTIRNPTAGATGARSTGSLTSGKFYFECTYSGTTVNGNSNVGICTASFNMANVALTGAIAVMYLSTGAIYNVSSTGIALGAVNAKTVCIAVDLTNSKIWYRLNGGNWNNSGSADPATNTGGINITTSLPGNPIFIHSQYFGDTTTSNTANFGASAFAFTAPSGFAAFDPPVVPIDTPSIGGYTGVGVMAWSKWGAEKKAKRRAQRKALGLPDEEDEEEDDPLTKYLKQKRAPTLRIGRQGY